MDGWTAWKQNTWPRRQKVQRWQVNGNTSEYSLSNCSDGISPCLCKTAFLLADRAHLLQAFKDLSHRDTQAHTLCRNTEAVRCHMAWKCAYSIKPTCFSLLWIINPGRHPRARAEPQRVRVCGLLSPTMYWDTSTSTDRHIDKHKHHAEIIL